MSTTTVMAAPVGLEHQPVQDVASNFLGCNSRSSMAPNMDTAGEILSVIERYRMSHAGQAAIPADSRTRFLKHIAARVAQEQPVRMCLPAFPFKSPNTVTKVLGRLPDKAEEFALAHLHGMCAAIQDIYKPGAKLTIISDGLVYNDLLGVADSDVWAYGTALRTLSVEKGFSRHLGFSRLNDLLQAVNDGDDELDEAFYLAKASEFRDTFLSRFSDEQLDVSEKIKGDDDTCMTYRGYIRFLATDLANVYPTGPSRSKSQYKREIESIAKKMLHRGDAFARAVKERFFDHLRLSIHTSTLQNKISICLLPTDTTFTTPWHSSIAFRLDGSATTGQREFFERSEAWELVHENGRPSFFRERADLYALLRVPDEGPNPISITPLYPAGLLVRPATTPSSNNYGSSGSLSFRDIDPQKLRGLAEHNSPVVLRGFAGTTDRDAFVAKAHELGEPTPWKFGLVLEVKDRGADTRGLNNVLSAEWMPWHYDGLFKTEKRNNADGTETVVSTPPRFQMFTSITTSPPNTGFTLFASSSLVTRYLPRHLPPLDDLRARTWAVQTGGFEKLGLGDLPLFMDHPTTGRPCLRFHEPWPQAKTRFKPTAVTIEREEPAASDRICEGLSQVLHDRRVAYYHAWEKGDLLLSDNILAMHTRSNFTAGCDRELWRIHFD